MSFKSKVFIIVLGGFAVVVGAVLVLGLQAYRTAADSLAEREVLRTFGHARSLLLKEIDHLGIVVADWSVWDDTRSYVLDRNGRFAEANLQESAFRMLRVDHFAVHDRSDRPVFVYSAAADPAPATEALGRLRSEALAEGASADLLRIGDAYVLAAVHAVVGSDGSGPPVGTLAMVRNVDEEALAEISSVLDARILLEGVCAAVPSAAARVEAAEDGAREAVGPVRDGPSVSDARLRVRPLRRVADPGYAKFLEFLAAGVAVAVLAALSVLWALDRYVVRRIGRIGRELESMAGSGRHDRRVSVDGDDEISRFGAVLNRSFDSLEKSFAEIERGRRELEKSLSERDSLFREIRHRVKNNLQVVASMLAMQAEEAEQADVSKALRNGRRRVLAIANVHEELYCSDSLYSIALDEYLKRLIGHLRYELDPEGAVRIELETGGARLSIERAQPFALIANEALANAFVHAFRGGTSGAAREKRVSVGLDRTEAGECVLRVADNGCGLDSPQRPRPRLGMTLIATLAGQLGGRVSYEAAPEGGAVFCLFFAGDAAGPAPSGAPAEAAGY